MTRDEVEAFAAAWRCLQAASDAEGIYFGRRADNLLVAAMAMQMELPEGKDQYEYLLREMGIVT